MLNTNTLLCILFFPLQHLEFDHIEAVVRDENGDVIDFCGSLVTVILKVCEKHCNFLAARLCAGIWSSADFTGPVLTHNWFSLRICYFSVYIDSYSVAKFLT
jgi:hypothetical protein